MAEAQHSGIEATATQTGQSVYAQHAWAFLERGLCVIPIAPGTKKPGQWTADHGWRGMPDWTRFAERLPTELELEHWNTWPDAGMGLVLGKLSGVIGLDKDYDVPGSANDALERLVPYTPFVKKGQKGWTKFYRWSGEASHSYDVGGKRVLDVLSDGRQTVMPPTVHPSGCSYVWISPESLCEVTSAADLPALPPGFFDQVKALLKPYQTEDDVRAVARSSKPRDDSQRIDTELSIQGEYFRDLNRAALDQLDAWVPKLVSTARRHGQGYRCIATWRNCENPNVGIHPHGITDFGGNYGMTPLDLVMYANGLGFQRAAEVLRACLALAPVEAITMTASGAAPAPATTAGGMPWAQAASGGQAASLPTLPWMKAAEPPPTVVLPPDTSVEAAPAIQGFIASPPGILSDIAQWITATAPKAQPELSLAAAIALCATVTQRVYRSSIGNYTSLYLAMVAKSTEGKEHPQSCVERALAAAGLGRLIAGSGYTSAGAVFSALLRSPSHLAVIDEMGKLLKMSRSKGNANSEAAIDKLVEAFGRLGGVIRPPTYSTMSLTPKQASATGADKVIHNPAITLLMATTPGTFYGNLTDDLVQDGFLGRLLVVESTQPRQLARFVDQTDPPPRVIEWLKAVHTPPQRTGDLQALMSAEMPAHTVEMVIGEECQALQRRLELELNALKDQLEGEGLDVLLGRTAEKALRLSMIVAKATDPNTLQVRPEHLEWAIQYVRHCDMAMIRAVRKHRVVNMTDAGVKKLVDIVSRARKLAADASMARFAHILANGGMPRQVLLKKMKCSAKELTTLCETARDAGVLRETPAGVAAAELGYPGEVYYLGETE